MSLERSGRQNIFLLQSRVGSASSFPTLSTDGIEVPTKARGAITHILVRAVGTGSTVACRVAIVGYMEFDTGITGGTTAESDIRNQWFTLAQLNGAQDITATTKVGTAPASNNLFYAESLNHVSMYDRIYAVVSNLTAVSYVTVGCVFESGY